MIPFNNTTETQMFQSTHPRGVRPSTNATMTSVAAFQSTHPRGVRPKTRRRLSRRKWFQSTHPRGVRRRRAGVHPAGRGVSIHAPAWGATQCFRSFARQHHRFQSTHPRGVRLAVGIDDTLIFLVSIHAPAWGATAQAIRLELGHLVSIHAPAWGATFNVYNALGYAWLFQSTHPRGVRRSRRSASSTASACFNPRTRVGCDSPAL